MHPLDGLRARFRELEQVRPETGGPVAYDGWVALAGSAAALFEEAVKERPLEKRAERNRRLLGHEVKRIDAVLQHRRQLALPELLSGTPRQGPIELPAESEAEAAVHAKDLESLEGEMNLLKLPDNVLDPWISEWLDVKDSQSLSLVNKRTAHVLLQHKVLDKLKRNYKGHFEKLCAITAKYKVHISSLDLYGNPDCESAAAMKRLVTGMPQLRTLDLSNTGTESGINGAGLAQAGEFLELTGLRLENCFDLEGSDFAVLRQLINLQSLSLRSTHFSDADIEYLIRLSKLRELNLSTCPRLVTARKLEKAGQFTVPGFEGLSQFQRIWPSLQMLKNLETLDLTRTSINGQGLRRVSTALTALRTLDLTAAQNDSWEALKNDDIVHVKNLKELEELVLEPCTFNSSRTDERCLVHLINHPSLRILRLRYFSPLTEAAFARLLTLPKLEGLDLCSGDKGEEELKRLTVFPNLKALGLRLWQIVFVAWDHLKKLPKLQILDVGGCGFSDATMAGIQELRALEEIDLRDNQLTDACISDLANAKI